jgi:hypothetical protein
MRNRIGVWLAIFIVGPVFAFANTSDTLATFPNQQPNKYYPLNSSLAFHEVSVSSDGKTIVASNGYGAYQATYNPNIYNPSSGAFNSYGWKFIGGLANVTAGFDGYIAGVSGPVNPDGSGNVYLKDSTRGWCHIPNRFSQKTLYEYVNKTFTPGYIKHVAFDSTSTLYGLDSTGRLYYLQYDAATSVKNDQCTYVWFYYNAGKLNPPKLVQISPGIGSYGMVGVDANRHVWLYTSAMTTSPWIDITPPLTNGMVHVTRGHYKCERKYYTDYSVVSCTAGTTSILATDGVNIYKCKSGECEKNIWTNFSLATNGYLKQISVIGDGILWGSNMYNQLFQAIFPGM